MPGGLSAWTFLGSAKGIGPWIAILALAFYVGSDHATIVSRQDALAHADTVNMVNVRGDLWRIQKQVDTIAVRQQREMCYIIHNVGPECAK